MKSSRALILGFGLALAALAMGCGHGSSGGPPPPAGVSVVVSPATAQLRLGGTQQFTASVTGSSNTAVTWSVNNIAGGNSTVGTISASGLYTAPGISALPSNTPQNVSVTAGNTTLGVNIAVSAVPAKSSMNVKATSQADSTKSGSASAVVAPLAFIAVGIGTSAGVTGASVKQGSNATLFLVGNGFVFGTVYKISGPPGDVTVTQPLGGSFTQTTDGLPAVNVSIFVSASAAPGPRNIMVTDPAGELTVFPAGLLITQ